MSRRFEGRNCRTPELGGRSERSKLGPLGRGSYGTYLPGGRCCLSPLGIPVGTAPHADGATRSAGSPNPRSSHHACWVRPK